jgi:hypothetical protein
MSAVRLGEKNMAITNAASAMREDRVSRESQRGEGAGKDQAGRANRRAGMPERDGGGLAWLHALPRLLAQPRDHQDVVVRAERDHE